MGEIMIKNIEEYFKLKTDNLSFIQLKPGTFVDINGYKLTGNIPMPVVINDLVKEIKEQRAQEELKVVTLIEGIIYTLAVDKDFKYIDEYKEILYSYDEKIEEYLLLKGLKFAEEGSLEEAIIYFKSLVTLNENNISGLYNYALALEGKAIGYYKNKENKTGDIFLKESTKSFEEILNIDPTYEVAYYKLGYHYSQAKQFKKAMYMWEKFIDISKDKEMTDEIKQSIINLQDNVTYEEGYTEVLRGNTLEGLEKLLPLKEKYSDWWNLLFMIGLAYRHLGQYNEAKEHFEKVLLIYPDQIDTLNELGLSLASLGDNKGAIEKFSRAIVKRPNDHEVLCNRGMTYYQLGQYKKAIDDIEKAYEMDPNDEITIACKRQIDILKENME